MSKSRLRAQLYIGMALVDLIAIAASFLLAALLRTGSPGAAHAVGMLAVILPSFVIVAAQERAYGITAVTDAARSVGKVWKAFALAIGVVIGIAFYLKVSTELSRLVIGVGGVLSFVALAAGRLAMIRLARRLFGAGGPRNMVVLLDGVEPPDAPGAVFISATDNQIEPRLDDPMMLDRLGRCVRHADRVIVACPPDRRAAWAFALKGAGVNVEVLTPELDALGGLGVGSCEGTTTAIVARGPLGLRNRIIKRAFDLFLVAWILPTIAPLMLIVAILIKLESKGPVFFVQPRVGQGNRVFQMVKFRSMRTDTLDVDGASRVGRVDPRVTRVGRFIRLASIDELPQLINVLRGEMSIVGPRPHALFVKAGTSLYWEVDSRYWHRHAAVPGLTGLAQVRGHRGATLTHLDLTNRVQSDMEYLSGWSIWRDIRIILQTFLVVCHKNAY